MTHVLLGGGGHAASVLDAMDLELVRGVACSGSPHGLGHVDLEHLGSDAWLLEQDPASVKLVNGIGLVPGAAGRIDVWNRFVARGFEFVTVVHPTAHVSSSAVLGSGVQVLGGAQVNAGAVLGDDAVINTAAVVEHHVRIGEHSHLATGAITTGGVTIGDRCFVGAGAVLVPGVTIGDDVVIGAGAVVIDDVANGARVVGVPAR